MAIYVQFVAPPPFLIDRYYNFHGPQAFLNRPLLFTFVQQGYMLSRYLTVSNTTISIFCVRPLEYRALCLASFRLWGRRREREVSESCSMH